MTAMSPDANVPPLRDAHAAMRVGPYVRGLWERRSYIWYVSVSELRSRQITTVLGNIWHLLNPALNIFIYYLIFGLLLGTDRGVDNFILFLSAGLFVFQYTQKVTIDGARAIVGNKGLLKAVHFPRALLPITATVTETLAATTTFVVLFGVALATGEMPSWRWLVLAPVIALQFVFNLGAAMISARLTTHFVDITQILPFIFRLLLYASGVIFSVDEYAEGNAVVEALFILNPLYCFITLGRWAVMGSAADPWLIVSAIVWSISLAVIGFFWFRAAEEAYARD